MGLERALQDDLQARAGGSSQDPEDTVNLAVSQAPGHNAAHDTDEVPGGGGPSFKGVRRESTAHKCGFHGARPAVGLGARGPVRGRAAVAPGLPGPPGPQRPRREPRLRRRNLLDVGDLAARPLLVGQAPVLHGPALSLLGCWDTRPPRRDGRHPAGSRPAGDRGSRGGRAPGRRGPAGDRLAGDRGGHRRVGRALRDGRVLRRARAHGVAALRARGAARVDGGRARRPAARGAGAARAGRAGRPDRDRPREFARPAARSRARACAGLARSRMARCRLRAGRGAGRGAQPCDRRRVDPVHLQRRVQPRDRLRARGQRDVRARHGHAGRHQQPRARGREHRRSRVHPPHDRAGPVAGGQLGVLVGARARLDRSPSGPRARAHRPAPASAVESRRDAAGRQHRRVSPRRRAARPAVGGHVRAARAVRVAGAGRRACALARLRAGRALRRRLRGRDDPGDPAVLRHRSLSPPPGAGGVRAGGGGDRGARGGVAGAGVAARGRWRRSRSGWPSAR